MLYSDLHTHTLFSDGRHSVEAMVQGAIAKGLCSIGISDHIYTPFDLRYCMDKSREGEYLAEIRRVRDLYADQIEVYAGLEWDGYCELRNREEYDYLIGDCHYVKTWDGFHSVDHAKDEQWAAIEAYFNSDPIAYARAYYETYVHLTRQNRPDVLGHFDVVTKHNFVDEENPVYRRAAVDALAACLEITPVIEVNTGSVIRKWRDRPFPAEFLLREIRALGGKIIFSSDSHCAENIAGWFAEGTELAKAVGFKSAVALQGGKFVEVGL